MSPAPAGSGVARLIRMDDSTAWPGRAPVPASARRLLGTVQSAAQASLELSAQDVARSPHRGPQPAGAHESMRRGVPSAFPGRRRNRRGDLPWGHEGRTLQPRSPDPDAEVTAPCTPAAAGGGWALPRTEGLAWVPSADGSGVHMGPLS